MRTIQGEPRQEAEIPLAGQVHDGPAGAWEPLEPDPDHTGGGMELRVAKRDVLHATPLTT